MQLLRMGLLALGIGCLQAAAPAPSSWQSAPAGPVSAASDAAPVLRRDLAPVTQAPMTPVPASTTPMPVSSVPSLRTAPLADPAPVPPLPVSAGAPPAPISTPPVTAPRPLLRESPPNPYGPQRMNFPDGVTALFGVTYQTLPGFRPLTLDLYQPHATGSALPLVVFIHGGGFAGGDSRHAPSFEDFPRALSGLAARGYVVASVNYRLSGEARFPAAVQDVKAALRWLGGQAGTYNIDATRIAVWGVGSGGQLAALTGVTCGVGLFEPEASTSASPDCVQAVIDWSGISDLKNLAADNGAAAKDKPAGGFAPTPSSEGGEFLGCEPANCPPALARLASPLGYVKATSPAFLIQHGAADAQVSPKQAQRLHDALVAAGAHAQLVLYPGVGHEFRRDGAPDPAINTQAMEQVTAFLAATFPYAPLGSAPRVGTGTPTIRRTVQN